MKTNNKLIAEFMGMQKTDVGWYDAEENLLLGYTNDNTFDELLFNKSWDWLMPVMQKILNICSESDNMESYYTIVDTIPNIESTYRTIVEFIKQN